MLPAGTCPLGWTERTVPGSCSLGCHVTRTLRPSCCSWRRTSLTCWPTRELALTSTVWTAAAEGDGGGGGGGGGCAEPWASTADHRAAAMTAARSPPTLSAAVFPDNIRPRRCVSGLARPGEGRSNRVSSG